MSAGDFGTVAVLILVAFGTAGAMLLLAHLTGPKRHGPVKDSTYESGMTPFGEARRRFHVRFYLVAVMYVVFSVEVVFLYPWAVIFPELRADHSSIGAVPPAGSPAPAMLGTSKLSAETASRLAELGYTRGYLFGAILIFFALLVVGFVYEWRKGVFRWD